MSDNDDHPTARAIRAIRDDERARCVEALEALFGTATCDSDTLQTAINALVAAPPPVSVAPVVPPEPSLAERELRESKNRCPRCSHHEACHCGSRCGEPCCGAALETLAGSPVVPAATEPVLAVIAAGLAFGDGYTKWHTALQAPYREAAHRVVADLKANGYVPLPRDLLLPLLDAVPPVTVGERNSEDYALLHATWRAVVEAVGPTRDDPLCLKCGHPTSYHLKVYGCICRCVGPTREDKAWT